jgi:adenylate cyclase class IV
MPQVEVEVKSLLGNKENANSLVQKLNENGFDISKAKTSSQLNHYFNIIDLDLFKNKIHQIVSGEKIDELKNIISYGKSLSVRTRDSNGKVIFVIKASLDEQTSSNGVTRLEFEEMVGISLDELDSFLLDSGLEYQAKWSRSRVEYKKDDLTVCIDKNAGYGYMAEFEKVVGSDADVQKVRNEVLALVNSFGLEELDQGRLARMFEHYNALWSEYYGTDNLFIIE